MTFSAPVQWTGNFPTSPEWRGCFQAGAAGSSKPGLRESWCQNDTGSDLKRQSHALCLAPLPRFMLPCGRFRQNHSGSSSMTNPFEGSEELPVFADLHGAVAFTLCRHVRRWRCAYERRTSCIARCTEAQEEGKHGETKEIIGLGHYQALPQGTYCGVLAAISAWFIGR